jgi:anhydro-N-acetylmuramic acid kinase
MGIPSDFKEAIAFAVLGYLRLHNRPGNLPRVTGARKPVALGEIFT